MRKIFVSQFYNNTTIPKGRKKHHPLYLLPIIIMCCTLVWNGIFQGYLKIRKKFAHLHNYKNEKLWLCVWILCANDDDDFCTYTYRICLSMFNFNEGVRRWQRYQLRCQNKMKERKNVKWGAQGESVSQEQKRDNFFSSHLLKKKNGKLQGRRRRIDCGWMVGWIRNFSVALVCRLGGEAPAKT